VLDKLHASPSVTPGNISRYPFGRMSRVARSVQCLTTDWTARVRSLTGAEDFSGAHAASYTVGTGGSFPGSKARQGRDADHSPPSSAEVKKE
jgi:hypothetical protein